MDKKWKEKLVKRKKDGLYKKLSIRYCRQILKSPDLTDEEVAQIRDALYAINENLFKLCSGNNTMVKDIQKNI